MDNAEGIAHVVGFFVEIGQTVEDVDRNPEGDFDGDGATGQ